MKSRPFKVSIKNPFPLSKPLQYARWLAAIVAAVTILLGSPGTTMAATSASGSITVARGMWGLGVANTSSGWTRLEEAMHRPFEAVGSYHALSGTRFPNWIDRRVAAEGGLLYLNIGSWHVVNGVKRCYRWSAVASGRYDSLLATWVRQLKAFRYPRIVISFHHEPNLLGDPTEPSCGSATAYRQAYAHVSYYLRSHGVYYPFVWTLTASAFINGYAWQWQPPSWAFSFVGVDGYNRNIGRSWRTPSFLFGPAILYARSRGKPLFVGEIGCVEDPLSPTRKANWVFAAANLFAGDNAAGVLWDDNRPFEPNTTSTSLRAWVMASQMPFYRS